MILPGAPEKLLKKILQLRDDCAASMDMRRDHAALLRKWRFTGSDTGEGAIYNRLRLDIDRKAAYLFSPSDLRFHIEFENRQPEHILQMAEVASLYLTRTLEAHDVDVKFATISILSTVSGITYWYNPQGTMSAHQIASKLSDFILGGLRKKLVTDINYKP